MPRRDCYHCPWLFLQPLFGRASPWTASGLLCRLEKKAAAAELHPFVSFQNNSNPAEDLRRAPPGLLALDNMLYFSRHTPNAYSRVRALSWRIPHQRGAGGSPASFPFFIVTCPCPHLGQDTPFELVSYCCPA